MATFNDDEKRKWGETLCEASLRLTEIVVEHSARRAVELRDVEHLQRKQAQRNQANLGITAYR